MNNNNLISSFTHFAHIIKSSAFLPPYIMTNDDLAKIVDTNDAWITQRTGIKQRHICKGSEDALHMAVQAVKRLDLSEADIAKIDVLIVATCTNKRAMPSIASSIHRILGCKHQVAAFDVSDACNGFVQAMTIACKYIHNTTSTALVIGVDHMSSKIDWTDRNTCILFGDGAGAMVISGEQIKNYECTSYTLSKFNEAIMCEHYLAMSGNEVFINAIDNISKDIISILKNANLSANDIDYYIIHQANARILQEVAKRIKAQYNDFDSTKIVCFIENMGNTSAATIPIAFHSISHNIKPNSRILMSGFAAGLRGGSVLLSLH